MATPTSLSTASEDDDVYPYLEGVEDFRDYAPGGYHPVWPGMSVGDYQIVNKLGYGGYSTVWLARDLQHRLVALKICTAGSEKANREVTTLRTLASSDATSDLIPRIIDDFRITGPNGSHVCYATAPLRGSLAASVGFGEMFPAPAARALSARLALAVQYIHARGFCHGDITMRNVLVGKEGSFWERNAARSPELEIITRSDNLPLPPGTPSVATFPLQVVKLAKDFTVRDARRLVLADFGEAFEPATNTRLGWQAAIPRRTRPPEALFEPEKPLSYPFDIFALGCVIWETVGWGNVFGQCISLDEYVWAQINVLGYDSMPPTWKSIWNREKGAPNDRDLPKPPRGVHEPWPPPLEQTFEKFIQEPRKEQQARDDRIEPYSEEESAALLRLMRGMLRLDPSKRITIDEVLQSEWMVRWALPELRGEVERIAQ